MFEAILSLLTTRGLQQEPYEAEVGLDVKVIALSESDLYHLKDRQEFFLFVPGEVSVRFAQSYDTLVLLAKRKHLFDEFGVWEEQISLLLQDVLEVSSLVKLIRCILGHVGSDNRLSMSVASDHVRDSLEQVLVLGVSFSNSLKSLLLDELLELSHLLVVSLGGQSHFRVLIVNGTDIGEVAEVVMMR